MKMHRLCISLVFLIGTISSCSSLPASSVPTVNETTTPVESSNHPSESSTVSPSFSLLPTVSLNNPSVLPLASLAPSRRPTASADPIMINEQKYIKFGMSRSSVKKELKKLGIKIADEGSSFDAFQAPEGFYYILIGSWQYEFDFNDQNQLYSITVNGGETTKGLKIGDPTERIQQIYGKPNEIETDSYDSSSEYLYYCNDYTFSIGVKSINNTVGGWRVFQNIWNDPNSYGITNAIYFSDDSIQFNEENFRDLFKFGMSRKELKKKLTGLGIRINSEDHYTMDDENTWGLETNHIHFSFDQKGLYLIKVYGWETAKGLQIGDSIEKLHQLYGKENGNDGGYIYNKKDYKFEAFLNDNTHLGLVYWCIYTR